MSDSGPTNEHQGVEDFFARQKDAQAAGDSEQRKQWYVEEYQRREGETRRKAKPWRYLGNTVLALLALYFLLAPWEEGFAHLDTESFIFVPALLSVVWLVAIVGLMVTRKLTCPKCHREMSKLVKNLCLHCAARLRLDEDQLAPRRRLVRTLAVFVIMASVGVSWLGARMHRNRQAASQSQHPQERAVSPDDEKTVWELDLSDVERWQERKNLVKLFGNPPYADVIQVRRALGECWLTCEENGREIARSDPVRLPLDTLGAASASDELICTAIFWEKYPVQMSVDGGEFTRTESGATLVRGGGYRQVLEFSAVLVVATPSATCKSDVTTFTCKMQSIAANTPDDLVRADNERDIATEVPVGGGEPFNLLKLHRRFPKLRSESSSAEDEPPPQKGVKPEIVVRLMVRTMDTERRMP